ncbi:putative acyl-CoA dehydrogenase [Hyaloraphidium curvatum]|nr:putative acyl-CoA dehydrogenase [Hyaloraphidium curvatum]
MPSLTLTEVARHNTDGDAYIVIKGRVYDVSKFAKEHPGGKKILLNVAGKDGSKQFATFHSAAVEAQWLPKLYVGDLADAMSEVQKASSAAVAPKNQWLTGDNEVFGDLAPFCEPAWYQDNYSPYYKDSHRRLRAFMRTWVAENILPHADNWEEAFERRGEYLPESIHLAAGKAGILRAMPGPVSWGHDNRVKDIPGVPALPGGVPEGEFDVFHEQIVHDELTRSGYPGVNAGITIGAAVGIAPLMAFGSPELQRRVIPAVLNGEQHMSLAVTEPHAGSDVQGLLTRAVLSEDGKHFIVNGEKKWITGGRFATYFLTAVRTGGPGGAGISILLCERGPGLTTRHVYTQTSGLAGTSYVMFEDHKVPVGNLIGKLNEGFKVIMQNFNHERLAAAYGALRHARNVYTDALHYAHRRKTFGKLLIEHPVIRDKFAQMARQIESTDAWCNFLSLQFQKMPEHLQGMRLGGHTALLKLQATRTFEYCAREACQVMGGIAYTRGGQGGRVERLYREVRGTAIPGGSEEIMADLGARHSLKAAALMGAVL